MIIATEKRKTNIAEYILYMWQLEDLLRANSFELMKIEVLIIDKYQQPEPVKAEIRNWYKSMIDSMLDQKLNEKGHLTYLNVIIQELSELNIKLLQTNEDADYVANFNAALPGISEIIQKSDGKIKNEIEACLVGLYGFLTMRLRKQDISEATTAAVTTFSQLMARLSLKYKQFEEGELTFD